ncbi:TatD family deoxyribonuclease [Sporosarcina sp. BI001-red]|uniref:TatD family hydrolase n=1 Tax=Sporosarcina sp. BI001-red TaxID=2282866 RepID=UPI000E27A9B9|nr:TatD family hydrolase [Sporosarcina sp. BI001-red]REB08122.1 TatD family deoxyribonuclease [Sporosarcina sp. BI001-red]
MYQNVIDAHIHLDMYTDDERVQILKELEETSVKSLIAVSNNMASSLRQLEFAQMDSRVKPAIGYHPEQPLPSERELEGIMELIHDNHERLIAIGEVGLPYYLSKDEPEVDVAPYVTVLERFVQKAADYDLPIVLHAVYQDAEIVCDILESYHITNAHFHWFKGDDAVLERVLRNGYVLSVTPDVTYEQEIQHIVKQTPLSQLMVETDGPWPFKGYFAEKMTHPAMMHHSIHTVAHIKGLGIEETYRQIYETTRKFYRL